MSYKARSKRNSKASTIRLSFMWITLALIFLALKSASLPLAQTSNSYGITFTVVSLTDTDLSWRAWNDRDLVISGSSLPISFWGRAAKEEPCFIAYAIAYDQPVWDQAIIVHSQKEYDLLSTALPELQQFIEIRDSVQLYSQQLRQAEDAIAQLSIISREALPDFPGLGQVNGQLSGANSHVPSDVPLISALSIHPGFQSIEYALSLGVRPTARANACLLTINAAPHCRHGSLSSAGVAATGASDTSPSAVRRT